MYRRHDVRQRDPRRGLEDTSLLRRQRARAAHAPASYGQTNYTRPISNPSGTIRESSTSDRAVRAGPTGPTDAGSRALTETESVGVGSCTEVPEL
ncbi:hypothetical protein EVAR_39797_1 [Eumeta japonica]|uniref:Uncharacterized protein n=1 Tax=Eumeta variegata TaxID=151549 RepID=A0A4C1X4L9_EUMVA|nr:hypothetical protein EVAR_39797_1 [Eumeta japonica]